MIMLEAALVAEIILIAFSSRGLFVVNSEMTGFTS